jgi:anti-anti-sigma factor
MSFDVRAKDDVVILSPRGDMYGGRETDQVEQKILELDRSGNQKLLLNLGKTTYMNTPALEQIFTARNMYEKRGAKVKLCCIHQRVRQIFVMVKLPLVYGDDVHETEEEALESFRQLPLAAGS